jgi:hypothetical protein
MTMTKFVVMTVKKARTLRLDAVGARLWAPGCGLQAVGARMSPEGSRDQWALGCRLGRCGLYPELMGSRTQRALGS